MNFKAFSKFYKVADSTEMGFSTEILGPMFWLNINHRWFVPRPSHHQYASLKWSKTGWCGKAWKKANHHYHTSNSCCKVQESAGKLCMQVPTVYKNSVFCTTSIVQECLFKWGWASPTLAWLHCACVCVFVGWLVGRLDWPLTVFDRRP